MKKPKTIADLLAVVDVCIEVLEARARLLDSRSKGHAKKKQQEDQEGNVVDHRNQKQQPTDQKEKRMFRHLADAEMWCEIYRSTRHDLKECRTFLDHKKMLEKLVVQEPRCGDHHRADPNNDKQLDQINMIFGGSLSIASKTQGRKLEREINLA
jgi:hypothetical protein